MAKKTRTTRTRAKPSALSSLSYEQAIGELEQLIDRIESGEIGLEESLVQYERGVALLKRCRSIVDHAEQRLTELTTDEVDEDDQG